MFATRELSAAVDAARSAYAPDAIVLDCERDFETLPPSQAADLGLVVDSLDPVSYPDEWLPEDAPALLDRYAGADLTVGMPGDGSVVRTTQTDPPVVVVKPRVEGAPDSFVDVLVAEALVELHLGLPEHFLGFFEDSYRQFDDAVPLDPAGTYQLAAACYDGWRGLHTRDVVADWDDEHPELSEAWDDAGRRLVDRVGDLPGAVARGETDLADATELACAGIKHGIELPAPYDALDTAAYRDHGAAYAVTWGEKTFDAITDRE